jgi:hypothetical protein
MDMNNDNINEEYLEIRDDIDVIKNKLLEIDNELTGRADREKLLKYIEENKISGKIVNMIQSAEIRAIYLRKELNEVIKLMAKDTNILKQE